MIPIWSGRTFNSILTTISKKGIRRSGRCCVVFVIRFSDTIFVWWWALQKATLAKKIERVQRDQVHCCEGHSKAQVSWIYEWKQIGTTLNSTAALKTRGCSSLLTYQRNRWRIVAGSFSRKHSCGEAKSEKLSKLYGKKWKQRRKHLDTYSLISSLCKTEVETFWQS